MMPEQWVRLHDILLLYDSQHGFFLDLQIKRFMFEGVGRYRGSR